MLEAALATGTQVIWDLCHYGWPGDVDLLSAGFVTRFARFSAAVARFIKDHTDDVPFFSPVNEINFMVWGIAEGLLYPFVRNHDAEIKRQLVRAAIASCEAIRAVDRRARFTFPEPIINVLPPRSQPEMAEAAERHRQSQFEAWDMIA